MNYIELAVTIKELIITHLDNICTEIHFYFDKLSSQVTWLKDPFNAHIDPAAEEAEELAEFKVSNATKLAFEIKRDLCSFWLSLSDTYPILSNKASLELVQFATTYLCESEFYNIVTIKTKSRNRLDIRRDIRFAVSKTEPNIMDLVRRGQEQSSH